MMLKKLMGEMEKNDHRKKVHGSCTTCKFSARLTNSVKNETIKHLIIAKSGDSKGQEGLFSGERDKSRTTKKIIYQC